MKEVSDERYKELDCMAEETMCQDVSKTMQREKDKYVITSKPFTVLSSWDSQGSHYMDSEKAGRGWKPLRDEYVRAGQSECTVQRYIPVPNAPGVYKSYYVSYANGRKCRKSTLNQEEKDSRLSVLTWEELKERMTAGYTFQHSELGVRGHFPKEVMTCQDEKSFNTVKEDLLNRLAKGIQDSLPRSPMMKDTFAPPQAEEERIEAYKLEKWYDQTKDYLLQTPHEPAKIPKTFSTLMPDGYDDVSPYEELLVLGKQWEKSPLDKYVAVFTYTPITGKDGKLDGNYQCKTTCYAPGHEPYTFETGCHKLSWDDVKTMTKRTHQIYEAHQKSHGKFVLPEVLLLKDEKELETFKAKCKAEEEKEKPRKRGIHPKKGRDTLRER